MSTGAYGQRIPIYISSDEISSLVDISYCYNETREYDSMTNVKFQKLPSTLLTPSSRDTEESSYADGVVEGMYQLQLPISIFNKKGFYTVYIKPKEIQANIVDVGVLTAYPNVRGIILDTEMFGEDSMRTKAKTNGALVGWRIVYLNDNGKRMDYYRIVTSNNKCEPVVQAPTSSSDKSYTYRYDDSSTLTFLTVTPSSAPSFKSNGIPYIGKPTQRILLVNTLFEPVQLDIELATNDADTLATLINGSQLRDLDNGLVTTFNENDEIFAQNEFYTLKNSTNGNPVYEVKKNKINNIDFSQTINDK